MKMGRPSAPPPTTGLDRGGRRWLCRQRSQGFFLFSRLLALRWSWLGLMLLGCRAFNESGRDPSAPDGRNLQALVTVEGSCGAADVLAYLRESGVADRAVLEARTGPNCRFLGWEGVTPPWFTLQIIPADPPRPLLARFEIVEPSPDNPLFTSPWPVDLGGEIIQGPLDPFTHKDRFAWDVPLPIGTPILAAAAGDVIEVEESHPNADPEEASLSGEANRLLIAHANGFRSLYLHLDQNGILVEPGQPVARGQVIALSGHSGVSTQPHLHFEILDEEGMSRPSGLIDSPRPDGAAVKGDRIFSTNRLQAPSPGSPKTTPSCAVIHRRGRWLVEYDGVNLLDGSDSFVGHTPSARFRWHQSGGPPALIADPTAVSTTFTLIRGAGTRRVAFQLLAGDQDGWGSPAEMEFILADNAAAGRIRILPGQVAPTRRLLAEPQTPISADAHTWTLLIEAFNFEEGDSSAVELTDPDGNSIRRITTDRYLGFSLDRLLDFVVQHVDPPTAGDWALTLEHNGRVLTGIVFPVAARSLSR